jgi:hypothetical protein
MKMDGNPVRTRKQSQLANKHKNYYLRKYPQMAQVWYPLATKDEFANSGGFIEGFGWRGVLHTTEGVSYAGAKSAYASGKAPHFTVSFEAGKFQAWQHIPINKAARALAHPRGTVETNRARCIQIEIVAFAATSGTLQREYLDGIGKLMRWVETNTGIARSALNFHSDREGIVLARDTSPIRLSAAEWTKFSGWCGHQHVPLNSHWDPGAIDIDYLLSVDIGVRPMIDPPLNVEMVAVRKDRYTDNGVYVLGKDGAIFAFEGAVYYMGVNGQDFFRDREAAQLLFPDEAKAQTGKDFSNYKYIVQATTGELYGCPWR